MMKKRHTKEERKAIAEYSLTHTGDETVAHFSKQFEISHHKVTMFRAEFGHAGKRIPKKRSASMSKALNDVRYGVSLNKAAAKNGVNLNTLAIEVNDLKEKDLRGFPACMTIFPAATGFFMWKEAERTGAAL